MSESFSVHSSLTLQTNVETVLRLLIEQFETLDKRIKSSQEALTSFGRTEGEIGKEGSSIAKAFAELKLPGSLVSEITSVADFAKSIAGSAREAAGSWRQMAESARAMRSAQPPGGGGSSGGGGGRGGGRGGAAGGGGGPGNSIFGTAEERANARIEDQLRTAAANYPIFGTERERREANLYNQLMDAETRAAAAALRKAQAEERAAEAAERAAAKKIELARGDRGDIYGPLPYNQAIQGRDAERRAAEAENRWITSNDAARAAAERKGQLSHHDGMMGAMGWQMAGQAGTGFFESAIGADWELEHLFARISGHDNIARNPARPNMLQEIRNAVKTTARDTPGMKQTDVAEIYQDLMTVFGDPQEALDELKTASKFVNTLQLGDLHKGGRGDMGQALAMYRFIEDQGGAIDPRTGMYDKARFDEIAQKVISIAYSENFKVNPTDYLSMIKTAREAGMMQDDHSLYGELPYFMQSMNPSRLGTALFSNLQVLLGGRATPKTEDALGFYGMYGGKKLLTDMQGHPKRDRRGNLQYGWDQDTIAGEDILKHDTPRWIHDVLGKHITDKLGLDPTKESDRKAAQDAVEKVLITMTQVGQRSTIAGLYAEMYRNYEIAQKTATNIGAQNPEMQKHMLETDPMSQLKVYDAAKNELMVAIGDLVKGPAIGMLKEFVVGLNHLTDWIDRNKEIAKPIAEIAAGGAVLSNLFGGLAISLMFLKPMLGTLGTVVGWIAKLGGAGAGAGAGAAGAGAGAAGAGALRSIMWGGPIAGGVAAAGYGAYQGSRMTGEDIAKHGSEQGQTPLMMNEFIQPLGYYTPSAQKTDSLVNRPSSTSGTEADPLHVVVQNQISEAGISRGVASNIASRSNRPSPGYTGSDSRMDLLGIYAGVGGP